MPDDRIARAHCRSVSGEMNSGFANLRASLPMNLKARHPGHKVWAGAQPDIDRIVEIWTECLATYGGPFLFGKQRGMADAMYAPVVTRFLTYDVKLTKPCIAVLPDDHGDAGDEGVGRGGEARAGRHRRARHGLLRAFAQGDGAPFGLSRPPHDPHECGAGTSHAAGMSTDLKSAGETISRYSMSGE